MNGYKDYLDKLFPPARTASGGTPAQSQMSNAQLQSKGPGYGSQAARVAAAPSLPMWQQTPTFNMLKEGGTRPVLDAEGDLTSIINGKKVANWSPEHVLRDKPGYSDPGPYAFMAMNTETGAGGPNLMDYASNLMSSKADGSFAYSKPLEDGLGLGGLEPHRYDGPPPGLEDYVKSYRESTERGKSLRPITELDLIRTPWLRELYDMIAGNVAAGTSTRRITGIDENGNIHVRSDSAGDGMYLAPENANTKYAGYNNNLKSGDQDWHTGAWINSPYLAVMPYKTPVLGENEEYLYAPRAKASRGGRLQASSNKGKREK